MRWINLKGKPVHGFLGKNCLIRSDGRIEHLCSHGVGHPIGSLYALRGWEDVHGCDGCCFQQSAAMALDPEGPRITISREI
jgi:hypothetical protein